MSQGRLIRELEELHIEVISPSGASYLATIEVTSPLVKKINPELIKIKKGVEENRITELTTKMMPIGTKEDYVCQTFLSLRKR